VIFLGTVRKQLHLLARLQQPKNGNDCIFRFICGQLLASWTCCPALGLAASRARCSSFPGGKSRLHASPHHLQTMPAPYFPQPAREGRAREEGIGQEGGGCPSHRVVLQHALGRAAVVEQRRAQRHQGKALGQRHALRSAQHTHRCGSLPGSRVWLLSRGPHHSHPPQRWKTRKDAWLTHNARDAGILRQALAVSGLAESAEPPHAPHTLASHVHACSAGRRGRSWPHKAGGGMPAAICYAAEHACGSTGNHLRARRPHPHTATAAAAATAVRQ
jgi:hypothetical protein